MEGGFQAAVYCISLPLVYSPKQAVKALRQNPSGNRVILIFSGQKPCTGII